ncbi:hypothetical protein BJ912DRAFT_50681 [Pholiota molesta]|nr:hypothetical protein BJ912DRAFT_50681 [Pholiota molesta]
MKARVEEEERRVKDLHSRIAELSKLKKESSTQISKPRVRQRNEQAEDLKPKPKPQDPSSPTSPQEDKFWATKGEPSRILHFSENLLDEEVNLGDISSTSFGTPLAIPSQIPRLSLFASTDLGDDPTIEQFPPLDNLRTLATDKLNEEDRNPTQQPTSLSFPETPPPAALQPAAETIETPPPPPTATPTTRQRKVKVSLELEKIVSKIWATVSDIIVLPNRNSSTPSVSETIAYLQELSEQTPAPESPIASSASSTTAEGGSLPNVQQIQTAYLLTMLLTSPHYSMSLNQVKENLATKAKSSGIVGQSTTRVLFGCVAKRLVKIDRGGREQIVKFDV